MLALRLSIYNIGGKKLFSEGGGGLIFRENIHPWKNGIDKNTRLQFRSKEAKPKIGNFVIKFKSLMHSAIISEKCMTI